MSAIVPFRFAIEGHYFTVIEVDGINHKPLTATSLSISAGQRYSIVLHASQKINNYWITFPTIFLGNSTTSANPNYNGSEAYAVLHYKGAPDEEPASSELVSSITGALGTMGGLQEYQLTVCAFYCAIIGIDYINSSHWKTPSHLEVPIRTLLLSSTSRRPSLEIAALWVEAIIGLSTGKG